MAQLHSKKIGNYVTGFTWPRKGGEEQKDGHEDICKLKSSIEELEHPPWACWKVFFIFQNRTFKTIWIF